MEDVGGDGFRENIAASEMGQLTDAPAHRFGDLLGVRRDDNAAASSHTEISPRHPFEEQWVERIGEKNGDRVIGLPAELTRAHHGLLPPESCERAIKDALARRSNPTLVK